MKRTFEIDGAVDPLPRAQSIAESSETRAAAVAAIVAQTAVEQADHAMRNWTDPLDCPVRIGSPEHLRMYCNMLLQTHNPYKPSVIDWPPLSADALKRVTSLPIWDIAVQTDGRASVRVHSFAARQRDALLRSALQMDADE